MQFSEKNGLNIWLAHFNPLVFQVSECFDRTPTARVQPPGGQAVHPVRGVPDVPGGVAFRYRQDGVRCRHHAAPVRRSCCRPHYHPLEDM